jgi:hypothetical protein
MPGKQKSARTPAHARPRPTRKRPRAATAAAAPVAAAPAGVTVVNMIPQALSGETNQDSEPMLAVIPHHPANIVGTAFTPDPLGGPNAPVYVSTDGGNTWVLNPIVPGGGSLGTGDITVAFSGSTAVLYAGILRGDQPRNKPTRLNVLKTRSFTGPSTMGIDVDRLDNDQPFTQATTDAGKDRVFVGNNDFLNSPSTATVDVSQDGGAVNPQYTSVRLEKRATAGQDGPQIRPAIHSDGTVYAAFYGWRALNGNLSANTLKITADVVVVRDDAWGNSTPAFEALLDPGDGLSGIRVVQGIQFHFNRSGMTANGQQRLGGSLSLAVHPGDSATVYLAWGDDQPAMGFTLHVRRSTDKGVTWSKDLLTLDHATNGALAVNSAGVVGLLYQQLVGTGSTSRWQTHFQRSTDGGVTWTDLILADTPALTPVKTFDPYLGDYVHVLAVGPDFYGIFSANNTPDLANFPSGVTYQRNADFNTHTLLDVDGVTPVNPSIDPFFFKVKS